MAIKFTVTQLNWITESSVLLFCVLALSSQGFMLQMDSAGCVRPAKFCKKKRSSASVSSDSTEVSLPPPTFDNLHDKILKKDKHLDGEIIQQILKLMNGVLPFFHFF